MASSLNGSTALVTGATSGIGRAIAATLAARHAHVIISGRDAARGERVLDEVRAAGGKADFLRAHLTDAASATALGRAAREITGSIDILVNNAGTYPFVSTGDTTEELFDSVYAINVKVPLFLVAELAPAMVDRGRGVIINVTTLAASKGIVGATAYTSSKAAINQLTRIWAAEYGPAGVRVNAVSPGVIETEGLQNALGDDRSAFLAITPAGRVGLPQEVADAVAYLSSESASFVNGAFLAVDGGSSAL